MNENEFNPHVRFCTRRRLSASYSERIYAFDFRLFFATREGFTVELEDTSILLNPGSLLTVPPGKGYRLLCNGEAAELFIVNFDFDSDHTTLPARPPVSSGAFFQDEIFSKSSLPPFDSVFHLADAYPLEAVLEEIDRTEDEDGATARHVRSGLMKYLLAKAAQIHATRQKGEKAPLIQAVKTYVSRHFADPINNRTVAAEMGYHPHYLNTCFLQAEGITLHAYIEQTRLRHAQRMLTSTQASVYEIAQACGFAEASYFIKFFSRHMGMTPRHYRTLCM